MSNISVRSLNIKFEWYVCFCPNCKEESIVLMPTGEGVIPIVYPNFCPACGYEFKWDFKAAQEKFHSEIQRAIHEISRKAIEEVGG